MENITKTQYKALRMSDDLISRITTVKDELGISFSAFIRVAAEEKMTRFHKDGVASVRDKIILAPTRVNEHVEGVPGSGSVLSRELGGLQKRDWTGLSHAERTNIVKNYRAKKRGNSYDTALEEWFKFVE